MRERVWNIKKKSNEYFIDFGSIKEGFVHETE